MARRSESESQEQKPLEETPVIPVIIPPMPKAAAPRAEKPMPTVEHVSSRSLPPNLVAISEKLSKELVSNQAYKVNGTAVLWVGSQKKIFFGENANEAHGATMMQAATAAGIA